VAIRTIRAYHTTSADASLVLANMLLANLLVMERTRIWKRLEELDPMANLREEERAISVTPWQKLWDRSTKARWTYRLLPSIGRWLNRPPIGLSFHITQALTGHVNVFLLRVSVVISCGCAGHPIAYACTAHSRMILRNTQSSIAPNGPRTERQ